MFLPAHLAIIFAKVQRTRRGSSEFSVEATEAPASARKVFVSNFVSLVSFPRNRSWLSSQGTTTHLRRLERCSASCVSLRLLIGTDRCVFCAGVREVYSPIRSTVARRVNALWPFTDPRRRFSRSCRSCRVQCYDGEWHFCGTFVQALPRSSATGSSLNRSMQVRSLNRRLPMGTLLPLCLFAMDEDNVGQVSIRPCSGWASCCP
jgi:hypothetical protein